ncbi:hypothetical protein ANTHELSMS3_00636 [Antarctobacter heliothermus]|uniref:Uncharacterized protein n=1 Tax=Antarctobacter heliothermus TaxID=74033 RepID=A0A222DZE4_9RHOB|nr:hypothetical protein [Antarctobacter heliothermus]ASP19355.1 hypothetical protein ANTHELSMS3_00636 [Antarctobacter heliothermus]
MPISYCISPDLDLLYARYFGPMRAAQFADIYQVYMDDPDYRLGRTELIDMSDATAMELNFEQVNTILMGVGRAIPKDTPPIRTVILAPSDVAFGLARMYQSLADYSGLLEVSVHRTEAGALSELGLSFPSVRTMLAEGGYNAFRHGRIDT